MNEKQDRLIGMTIRPIEQDLVMIFESGGAFIKIERESTRGEVAAALRDLANRIDDPKNQERRYIHNLKNCARCGENHNSIEIGKLTNPIDNFDFWGFCPNTGEPILVSMEP